MIKNGDNVILKFSTMWDGELCRDNGKAYIYPSMDRSQQYCKPWCEVLVEYAPVRHGQWIIENGNLVCSICHKGKPTIDGYEMMICDGEKFISMERTNFCGNCGAKMDGERKDNGYF